MRALIVYESMFGNTHQVADHIAAGLGSDVDARVTTADEVDDSALDDVDLLVVGGPTHVHGMTSALSRKAAADQAEGDNELELEPGADEAPGLKDWIQSLAKHRGALAAAFDTRVDSPPALTGRASKGIARRLRRHGFDLVADPESFLVDSDNQLLHDEPGRAEKWGQQLAASVADRAGSRRDASR
jgi:hypothetical protein